MINRRELLQIAAASVLIGKTARTAERKMPDFPIVDTNVSLFDWPFRRLPLDDTETLVKKYRSLGIVEAWAGSFEGVLHRDVAGVNRRLAEECSRYEELTPIGSVNPALPDWEEDLRRCVEIHKMPGIRLHPNYQGYALDDPRFARLLDLVAGKELFVQIAVAMEDSRTQHPTVRVADVDLTPLPKLMGETQGAKVQLLNYRPRGSLARELQKTEGIAFDTARVEGTDGVPRLFEETSSGSVMFGSHAPFLIPEAALIRVHESSLLDGKSLASLLADNAWEFVGSKRKSSHAASKNVVDAKKISWGMSKGDYRIWDSYFTPSHSHPGHDGKSRLLEEIERTLPAIQKGRFEKLCYFAHVGIGTTGDGDLEKKLRANPDLILAPLKRWPNLLLGMIQLNPHDVPASLQAIDRWIADGPMLGAYFSGGGSAAMTCTHKNFHPLVERIAELKGVIMQHVWFKTGGKRGQGESTPSELAELARRFPKQKFLCAHAGGEWQKGIRAVRDTENVLVETSGFDATAGFIEMAVRELGAGRIVFGSHLPSRSLGTELSKVTAAQISEADKRRILGENFRDLLEPILKSKSSEK